MLEKGDRFMCSLEGGWESLRLLYTFTGAVAVLGLLSSSWLAPMQLCTRGAAVSVLDMVNRGPSLQGCSKHLLLSEASEKYGYLLALKIRFCCSQTSHFGKY